MSKTQQVWDEFSAALRAFIRRRVNDDHVADDLVQEVFVRIYRNLDSLEDADRLTAWLYRIARNVVADHYRRGTNLELGAAQIQTDEVSGYENINQQVSDWLRNLVAHLPSDYREAITLSELESVPQTDISKRIGLSASGTKSRVQRGRKMLRDILLRCCHFEFDRRGNVVGYEVQAVRTQCCDSVNDDCDAELESLCETPKTPAG